MSGGILVAGIGNIFLGDDGFGCEVIRRIQDRPRGGDGVRVIDYGIRGMHLAYDLLDGCDALVLVDALPDRGTPGELRVFEADRESLSATGGIDVHSMDPGAMMATLSALGGTPPRTVVVGCQAGVLTEGIGLSPPVEAAVPRAVEAVASVVAMLRDDAPAAEQS
ncbi:MAG: hydrogenase maturation protease [Mycobacterium sp.]